MLIPEEGYVLRLLYDESIEYARKPLYQWIVETAHAEGLLQAMVLRAQRSTLFDLNRRGSISDEVYRQLTSEIDAQMNDLIETPAQHRAAERGPAASDEMDEVAK